MTSAVKFRTRRRRWARYGRRLADVNAAGVQRPGAVSLLLLLLLLVAPAAQADSVRLLVLGDSLAAGYGIAQSDGFVAQLERALRNDGYDVEVVNGGVSGDTTAGGRARLPWLLAGDGGGAPDAAIVELGANDALRGLDPEAAYENLDAIVGTLKAQDIPVLIAGMQAPPNMGREYADAFNAIYPRLAEVHAVPLYPFFLEGVAARRALNQPDGIHPNAAGVAVIVEGILPAVKRLIDDAAAYGGT